MGASYYVRQDILDDVIRTIMTASQRSGILRILAARIDLVDECSDILV